MRVSVSGNITADPELRFLESGTAVATFTVAENERRFNRDTNEWEDGHASFFRCSVWAGYAENVAESLSMGQHVTVIGNLQIRSWENDEGETNYMTEINVTDVGPSLRFGTAKFTQTTQGKAKAKKAKTSRR